MSSSSKGFKAGRARSHARPKAAGRLGLVALLLTLAAPTLFYAVSRAQQRATTVVKAKPQAPVNPQAPVPEAITSASIQPVSVTEVNFRQLAETARRARVLPRTAPSGRAAPLPGTIDDTPPGATVAPPDVVGAPAPAAGPDDTGGPLVASPSPSQSFLAQEDGPKLDGPQAGSPIVPPDTNGAVGLDRVFTNTNSNYRIHNKTTGAAVSTVSIDTFWASSGGSGFFDPQIQFDPYNQRWVLAVTSNASSPNSSINVAVSQTSDPAGSYNVYRFVVGCAGGTTGCDVQGEWADFPMLGFNKNWIAVTVNTFQVNGTGAGGAPLNNNFRALVLDYSAARAGTTVGTIFRGTPIGFCNHPVTTFSATEETLYLVQHLSSGGATYKVSTITGTPSVPSLTVPPPASAKTRPGGAWSQPVGDMLPQQCLAGCTGTLRKIDQGDSQVRSNPVFRNGRIYYAQTIALPAGASVGTDPFGNQISLATHTAAQWTVLDAPTGNFIDGGRVEDATATPTNGGKWYAHPSLSVNKNGDILLGFSEFESDDFADAGYTLRLGTDAPGTMRDPVIYKEGEDYYEKFFSGTRNRWGDYSHTLTDPSNDRDLWTVQEYAGTRVGSEARWGTWWAKVTAPAGAGDLLISEFRLFGPNGPAGTPAPEPNEDEFVEVYNNNDSPLTVATADGSAGYSLAASDGAARCTIPAGTVIPARGHFLCANSDGYSLGGHPAGTGTSATPDATYTNNIPNNSGVALFNTSNAANYSTATRLDAVGPALETNALYREGTGYTALTQLLINYSLYRDNCGKGGSMTTLGACPTSTPQDTNNNAADFVFVDTSATPAGAGQRLGAPGPENLSSPVQRNSQLAAGNLDPAVGSSNAPNRVRDFTVDAPNNSTFGTLLIRKTITNNTGAPVTRLRFRVIDQTTFPAPGGFADLRARTSSLTTAIPAVVTISGANPACPANTCTVQQTTLEQPPAQPNGGAFNSTLSVGSVTLLNPVPVGGSVNVQFLLGIQQTGTFKFFINVETLP